MACILIRMPICGSLLQCCKQQFGKDTIYNKILQDDSLMLSRIIPYTTRPIRDGETQDKDYHFCNEEDVKRLSAQGRIIELREYNTVYGVWKYFTVNDDDIDLRCKSYLTVGTLESLAVTRYCQSMWRWRTATV